jgi:hypothetical protein
MAGAGERYSSPWDSATGEQNCPGCLSRAQPAARSLALCGAWAWSRQVSHRGQGRRVPPVRVLPGGPPSCAPGPLLPYKMGAVAGCRSAAGAASREVELWKTGMAAPVGCSAGFGVYSLPTVR